MAQPTVSIIIPAYNAAAMLAEAIDSALAQTVPVEVLVIDNGSTDQTGEVCVRYDHRIRYERLAAPDAAGARNRGLELATGDYIQFLDHDDLLHPRKVSRCLDVMRSDVGFVYSDVLEVRLDGTTIACSEKYRYAEKQTSGWLGPQLLAGNFIQIQAPLYRRSAIGACRFHADRLPEDWHFLCAVADGVRALYLPEILATTRKQRGSRGSSRPRSKLVWPCDPPLRLNLGCGTHGKPSWHPLKGLVNMDKSLGWTFEQGLEAFADASVAGITISHSLMFVALEDWPRVFADFARVLMPGGVLRITEDDTEHPESKLHGKGWKGSESAVTLTGPAMVRRHLLAAGLQPVDVDLETTHYRDRSLVQAWHGAPPHVFAIEGVRAAEVLFSPHHDDETLFAAFTLIRHKPMVVACYPSTGDYGETAVREEETRRACAHLGAGPVVTWEGGDIEAQMRAMDARLHLTRVWAPHEHTSHPEHQAVARAAAAVFGDRLTPYHTYDLSATGPTKVHGTEVQPEPAWIGQKLRALAEYRSQYSHPRACAFFLGDLREYAGDVKSVKWAPGGLMPTAKVVSAREVGYPASNLVTTPAEPPLTVVTWHWGSMFQRHYVTRLRAMVQRRLHRAHRFVVVSDNTEEMRKVCEETDIEVIPAPVPWPGDLRCRRRIWQFSNARRAEFGHRALFLDLDIVITDDITPLVDRIEPIVACTMNYAQVYSPAFLLCDTGALHGLFEAYSNDPIGYPKKAKQRNASDLAMLNYYLKGQPPIATWEAEDGLVPYFGDGYDPKKHEVHGITPTRPELPPGTRVVMLGGADKAVLDEGRYDWVKEHWR